MSDLIVGTHLQLSYLKGQNIVEVLENFGQWTSTLEFQPLTTEVHKCMHKEREQRLKPVFEELGFTPESVQFQILRVLSRSKVDPGPDADMIPVRIQKAESATEKTTSGAQETAPGTIYDSSMNSVRLAIGQKIHLKKIVIVDPGMVFLLIRARHPLNQS